MIPNTNHDLIAIYFGDDDDGTKYVWPTPIVGWQFDEDKCLQPIIAGHEPDDTTNLVFDRSTGRIYQAYVYSGAIAAEHFPDLADQFQALMK